MMAEKTNMIDSVRNLQQSGMSRKQAEALTKLMRASIAEAIAEAVQHLATKAEVAELRTHVDAQLLEIRAAHDTQITLLRAELIEKMSANLKYMAFSLGFSTIAIIVALFATRVTT